MFDFLRAQKPIRLPNGEHSREEARRAISGKIDQVVKKTDMIVCGHTPDVDALADQEFRYLIEQQIKKVDLTKAVH